MQNTRASSFTHVIAAGLAVLASSLTIGVAPAQAGALSSAYSDLSFDLANSCRQLSKAGANDGDWVTRECPGFDKFKIYVMDDDMRRSVNFGPDTAEPAWESFGAFNHTASSVEWRLDDGKPFATIQRWFVTGKNGERATEVLVVEKVGRPSAPGGCAVALVLASDNPGAEDQARQIADEKARAFPCGKQLAERVGDVPDFGREKF